MLGSQKKEFRFLPIIFSKVRTGVENETKGCYDMNMNIKEGDDGTVGRV